MSIYTTCIYRYSVPDIYVAHFRKLFDIHKYLRIQTMFIQKYGKIPRFLLSNTPSSLSGLSTQQNIKSQWGFCIAKEMKVPG